MSVSGQGRCLESTLTGRARLTDGSLLVFVAPALARCSDTDLHKAHHHLVKGNVKRCIGKDDDGSAAAPATGPAPVDAGPVQRVRREPRQSAG